MDKTAEAATASAAQSPELNPPIDWNHPEITLPSREQISAYLEEVSDVCTTNVKGNAACVNLRSAAVGLCYLLDVSASTSCLPQGYWLLMGRTGLLCQEWQAVAGEPDEPQVRLLRVSDISYFPSPIGFLTDCIYRSGDKNASRGVWVTLALALFVTPVALLCEAQISKVGRSTSIVHIWEVRQPCVWY